MILKMAACFPKQSSNHKKLTIIWGSVAFRRVMGQEEVACTRVRRWDDNCGWKEDRKLEMRSFSAPELGRTGVGQTKQQKPIRGGQASGFFQRRSPFLTYIYLHGGSLATLRVLWYHFLSLSRGSSRGDFLVLKGTLFKCIFQSHAQIKHTAKHNTL